MGRPRKDRSQSVQIPTMKLPERETPKATYEPLKIDVPEFRPEEKHLYWFGTLPHPGKLKIRVPSTEYNHDLQSYERWVETTSEALWFSRPPQPKIWIGKCRYYQNLSVTGLNFPAFTEAVIAQVAEDRRRTMLPWPGGVGAFTNNQIENILYSVGRHFIRPMGRQAEIVNYDQGKAKDQYNRHNPRDIPIGERATAQAGDTNIAEYVYLVRLNHDVNTKIDEYYRLVPNMEDFFRNPPEMLAKHIAQPV